MGHPLARRMIDPSFLPMTLQNDLRTACQNMISTYFKVSITGLLEVLIKSEFEIIEIKMRLAADGLQKILRLPRLKCLTEFGQRLSRSAPSEVSGRR